MQKGVSLMTPSEIDEAIAECEEKNLKEEFLDPEDLCECFRAILERIKESL